MTFQEAIAMLIAILALAALVLFGCATQAYLSK